MEIFIQASQFIVSLSILIVIHEFGHFLPAKLFKTRVEKFYLFFNPWFSLFKVKRGETEYGLGWLPLGGYVKISGMIDESMDKEQMAKPAQPWEFRSKPVWQRLIIMVGGVTVNLIAAFLIYAMVLGVWGKDYLPVEELKYGYVVPDELKKYGFEDGDVILEIEGEKVENAVNSEINSAILFHNAETFRVRKTNGTDTTITLPEDIDWQLFYSGNMFDMRFPAVIRQFTQNSTAKEAGVKLGDEIRSVAGTNVEFWHEMTVALRKEYDRQLTAYAGKDSSYNWGDMLSWIGHNKTFPVELIVEREGQQLTYMFEVDYKGKLGIGVVSEDGEDMPVVFSHRDYSFFEAIPAGLSYGTKTLSTYVSQMKYLGSEKGFSSIGGFGTFGKLFSPTWDWRHFWTMTAFISVILAFMNILPIPALDGGHVMFLIYEMIAGKPPNQKFMEYAQLVGIIILFGLILYANANDIIRAM